MSLEDRDPEIEKARSMTAAKQDSPVSEAIDRNSELIMAIEKQVEVLASRLEHVSSSEPGSAPGDSIAGRGNSSLASRLHSQGASLGNISDRLSYITRMLEI